METLLSVLLGICLAAACGFRVFVPLLALSIAAQSGHVTLAKGFQWVGSAPALVVLATATAVEILAYYLPLLDHLLDAMAAPAAVTAGVVAAASVLTDLPPAVQWSLALIAGGGAAGAVHGGTALLRLKSTAFTGGVGNPIIATLESAAAVIGSVLALLAPLVAVAAVLFALFLLAGFLKRSRAR